MKSQKECISYEIFKNSFETSLCRNLPFLLLLGPIMYWKLLPPPIAINVTKCVLWQYVLPQNMCQCRHAALSQNQVIPVRQTWQSRDLNYRNIIYSHTFSNQSFKLFCWAEFYLLSGPRGADLFSPFIISIIEDCSA